MAGYTYDESSSNLYSLLTGDGVDQTTANNIINQLFNGLPPGSTIPVDIVPPTPILRQMSRRF
jgi:hypothetical protein